MGAKGNKSDLMDQPATAGSSDGTSDGTSEVATKEPKAPKAPKVKAVLGIKFLRPIDATVDKFNNQQKVLIDGMLKLANADGLVNREQLLLEVTAEALKSRQPAERVLGFYMNSWKKDVVKGEGEKARTIPALLSVVNMSA
jgi:hypothetical protein